MGYHYDSVFKAGFSLGLGFWRLHYSSPQAAAPSIQDAVDTLRAAGFEGKVSLSAAEGLVPVLRDIKIVLIDDDRTLRNWKMVDYHMGRYRPQVELIRDDWRASLGAISLAHSFLFRFGLAFGQATYFTEWPIPALGPDGTGLYTHPGIKAPEDDYKNPITLAPGRITTPETLAGVREAAEYCKLLHLDPADLERAAQAIEADVNFDAVHNQLMGYYVFYARQLKLMSTPLTVAAQVGWYRCTQCSCLVHESAPGHCWGANAPHKLDRDFYYSLIWSDRSDFAQNGWRWCRSCSQFFFGPGLAQSACPARFGAALPHDPETSGSYVAMWEDKPIAADHEAGWRWCCRCQSLFRADQLGRCVGQKAHDATGSGAYSVMRSANKRLDPMAPAGGFKIRPR